MYFYLIIALQGFCIYHLYKNRHEMYWYFVIIFIPVFGCLAYLLLKVYNKNDAEILHNEITTIINPTKKIRDLEKTSEFSDTFQNRMNLADAHFQNSDYLNAVLHYNKALDEHSDADIHAHERLITCYNVLEDYDKLIVHAEKIKDTFEFKKSKSQFLYGLALDKTGNSDEAETIMRLIDQRYSHYDERVILAKFLIHREKKADARMILNDILVESQHMNKVNKKLYKLAVVEAVNLLKELN